MVKRTQIFTLKDVPREYVEAFNLLAHVMCDETDKTKAEVFTDMVTQYSLNVIGQQPTRNLINVKRGRYDNSHGELESHHHMIDDFGVK